MRVIIFARRGFLIPFLMILAGIFQLNGIWSSVPVTEISILLIYTIAAHSNAAKRLKTLRGLTPYEYICNIWTSDPDRFKFDLFRHTVGHKHLTE